MVKDKKNPNFKKFRETTEGELEDAEIEKEDEINAKEWLAKQIISEAEGKLDIELLGVR